MTHSITAADVFVTHRLRGFGSIRDAPARRHLYGAKDWTALLLGLGMETDSRQAPVSVVIRLKSGTRARVRLFEAVALRHLLTTSSLMQLIRLLKTCLEPPSPR